VIHDAIFSFHPQFSLLPHIQALETYKEAISLIDKTMLLPVTMPTSDIAEEMEFIENKMKEMKKMINNFKMQRSVFNDVWCVTMFVMWNL
jgi:hypothetical protein